MNKEDNIRRIDEVCAEYFWSLPEAKGTKVMKAFEEYFEAFPVTNHAVDGRVVAAMANVVAAIDRDLPYVSGTYKDDALELYNFLVNTAVEWDDGGFQDAFDAIEKRRYPDQYQESKMGVVANG